MSYGYPIDHTWTPDQLKVHGLRHKVTSEESEAIGILLSELHNLH